MKQLVVSDLFIVLILTSSIVLLEMKFSEKRIKIIQPEKIVKKTVPVISPWKKVTNNNTILQFIHIPKTAGSSYLSSVFEMKPKIKNILPSKFSKSWQALKCAPSRPGKIGTLWF